MKKRTPAQQQYHELKQHHTDCVLFFRMGDFYEMFHDDAHIGHAVLGITLTARDKTSANPIPMAGIPHHALERYLPKLIDAGYKVALAEQVGEVIPGTVVRREVTQVITPGTYLSDDDTARHIVAIRSDGERYWTAHGESSLGAYTTGSIDDSDGLLDWLADMSPREVVLDVLLPGKHAIENRANQVSGLAVSVSDVPHDPTQYLCSLSKKSTLEGYGEALIGGGLQVMSLLAKYIETIQGNCLIQSIGSRIGSTAVRLDPLTVRNLELFQSQYEGTIEHSLVASIDHCKTSMGKRVLHTRLRCPHRDRKRLEASHEQISYRVQNTDRDIVAKAFTMLNDLTKIPARLQRGRDPQKVLLSLKTIAQGVLLDEYIRTLVMPSDGLVVRLEGLITALDEEGDFFVSGYDETLDQLRAQSSDIDQVLLAYHQRVVAYTGISGVRVKYTGTQGYCLETSKKDAEAFLAKADDSDAFAFHRRQSLKSAERFGTPYLAELEQKIHDAKYHYEERFQVLLDRLCVGFEAFHADRYMLCDTIASIDVAMSGSILMDTYARSLPVLAGGGEFTIEQGRHPVVEKFLGFSDQFIPNDLTMSDDDSFHLITGPNMGGKSTYLRQNALIVLLAHTGMPVPASQAVVPMVDGIYARVGSGDALAKNQSTFMTEMIEMANIINNATKDSFIVLDELGRGTSTYDGMSLAYALTVNLCQLGSKTLFATHYHELVGLDVLEKRLSNWQVSVVETDRDVIFMKKIIAGGADKSYGLHVARRAGIPNHIVDDAQQHLDRMLQERDTLPQQIGLFVDDSSSTSNIVEADPYHPILQQIQELEITTMTPVDALVHLHQLKTQLLQITSTVRDSL